MPSRKSFNRSDGVSELKFVKHLLNDLKGDLSGRVDRLMMLEELYNEELSVDYLATPGGELVQDVWREVRWCFVHANYIASVILCQVFIEHLLASAVYGAGADLPERVSFRKAKKVAKSKGFVSDSDLKDIDQLIKFRNPLTHFQRPGDDSSAIQRSVKENQLHFELTEQDSIFAIRLAVRMLRKLSL